MSFSHPALKTCNSPYLQYYFKRFFLFCIPRKFIFISDKKSQAKKQ